MFTVRSIRGDWMRIVAKHAFPQKSTRGRIEALAEALKISRRSAYAYVRQIVNGMRQSRPRMRAHSMNSEANAKVADILTGIFKHIEVNSDADTAYDTAGEYAVRIGWGYWRVVTDYVREDSFDQEIYLRPIDNPFSVYFDPNSVQPDGSDAEKVLITQLMSKADFEKQYPNADSGGDFNQRGTGDFDPDWVQKEDIRVAEYFYVERKKNNKKRTSR